MRRSPTRHVFVEDPSDDDPLWQRCFQCYLPRQNAIHDVPELTDEQRAEGARRVGERA